MRKNQRLAASIAFAIAYRKSPHSHPALVRPPQDRALRPSHLRTRFFDKSSATISRLVSDAKQARRYYVSGFVQGVGFRNFVQHAAERLGLHGYVRNLPDGRVEAYAIGPSEDLAKLRAALERGPRFASVTGVFEESAEIDSRYVGEFTITFGD